MDTTPIDQVLNTYQEVPPVSGGIPHNVFSQIFADLIFFKVKVFQSYAFYVASIQTFTNDGQRYVILLVPFDQAYATKARISQLPWSSLQTRTLKDNYSIPEQALDHKVLDSRYHDKIKLTVKNRTYQSTEYYCPLPIEISLLHNTKKKSMYQHPDELDLRQALNTYQCVIKLL